MSALRFIPVATTAALFILVGALLPLAPASAQANTNNEQRATNNVSFDIPAQNLGEALSEFARQSGQELIYAPEAAQNRSGNAVIGEMTRGAAMEQLLDGTGLEFLVTPDGGMMIGEPATVEAYRSRIRQRSGQTGADAAVAQIGQRRPGIEEIIVTGQKREERIQDVPIAISAFTQEDLTVRQIAGGPDLMTQIPNFTFTKTNFTSYSIQIRGIGTQAISATVDPAVAVAFNNTPFITNRFFEQEFYDMERVEVLRGPQGTLFGRNATAGVVNLISARPVHGQFEAMLSGDVANYNSRRWEFMVNTPVVDDRVAFRLAAAGTKRDGFVTNTLADEQTDGRDLWSTRASLRITPTDQLDINLIWEHFEEDDDRLRSGKQLCTRHDFPEALTPLVDNSPNQGGVFSPVGRLSQGCQMGSLYEEEAFQVPNGFSLPFYGPLANLGLPIFEDKDPFAGTRQSRDLREIETHIEPIYEARSDILHLAVEYDLTDGLTLNSETAWGRDDLFSHNDFNRFNTRPNVYDPSAGVGGGTALEFGVLDEDGTFCDPQLGCSNRLVLGDLATSDSEQFSQEFRITSNFDGPFNFHLGANYLNYDTTIDYFVFANSLSLFGAIWCGGDDDLTPENPWDPHDTEATCIRTLEVADPDDPVTSDDFSGFYIDRNPLRSLDGLGRNYFLSRNPFDLESYSVFGEGVYNLTDTLKFTAGLRYTVDRKEAPDIPSWLLVSQTFGLPTKGVFTQTWREPTGRLVLDWQPALGFTDETLLYASYARGYKAGGSNPPLPGALPLGLEQATADFINENQPKEFGPEFVDAFEIGTKNTLFDGRVTFNLGAFYYDYQGYQISQIVNRSAVNFNFDAKIWGLELETDWRPLENLVLSLKGGLEDTEVGESQGMIDMIDRTAGDPDWTVVKPFPATPSNCILPTAMLLEPTDDPGRGYLTNFAGVPFDCDLYFQPDIDPVTGLPFEPNPTHRLNTSTGALVPLDPFYDDYPGFHPGSAPNAGAGIAKDIGGNELPNAPDTTLTLSVDYTIPLSMDWLLTLHADYYRQSEAWTRIYNEDPYDKLKPFSQVNLAAILADEGDWNIMFYIKNLQDKDNITGAFLNSDDAGLTTNVFLNEPRLYGLRVTKRW